MGIEKYRLRLLFGVRLGCDADSVALDRPDEAVHHLVVEPAHPAGLECGEVMLEQRVQVAD
ncbi:hypothetical protein [Streptomyces sp. NPDC058304]|uniref:hypothetical protein n=1 Tax=Streptomyces sp. NPDC058304 TaxID=3346437 RepID=UPI0036E31BAA